MKIKKNQSLKKFNTYVVDSKADYFVEVKSKEEFLELMHDPQFKDMKKFILGGGSNLLFVNDYEGLVIKMGIPGKEILEETEDTVKIRVGAGEDWDELVRWAVDQNYGGMENMVMIPGTFGGAVAQNIAAYGQNVMDLVKEVEVYDRDKDEVQIWSSEDCEYTYRESIFKRNSEKYVVLSAVIELECDSEEFELDYHERKGRYGSLVEALEAVAESPYSVKDVMDAVIYGRTKRLPTEDEYGTCGSYFKNPVITVEKYRELKKDYPDMQCYPVEKLSYKIKDWNNVDGMMKVKVPAGYMIDEMGYLDHWEGNVGISPTHGLCVVSNKKASGKEIQAFAERVKDKVKEVYGVEIEDEVIVVD